MQINEKVTFLKKYTKQTVISSNTVEVERRNVLHLESKSRSDSAQ